MPVEANITADGDSTSAALIEFTSVKPVQAVDWREGVPESPDRYWRFRGYVDFESPFQEFPIASIIIEKWDVLRRTPKGVWVTPPFSNKWCWESDKKLVINDTRKKFAYPTKKEAWESYCIRQHRRRGYWEAEGSRLEALDAVLSAEKERLGKGK